MTVYEAIHTMRLLSRQSRPFAFSFMSYSVSRRVSQGEVAVEHALLLTAPAVAAPAVGEPAVSPQAASPAAASPAVGGPALPAQAKSRPFLLTFRDLDTGAVRQCWQPLILSFNHQPLQSIQ